VHANAIEQYATVTITGVTIASPPVVNFTVVFPGGASAEGLTGDNFRFTIAKLVLDDPPAAAGTEILSSWVSYIYDDDDFPSRESATEGTLTDLTGGSYSYTFATDIDNTAQTNGVVYEADLTHRVGMELRGSIPRGDAVFDFVPVPPLRAGAPASREIVTTAACNACHNPLAEHGNGRFQTDLCVLCHNPGLPDDGNLARLVHKIHSEDNNVVIGTEMFDFSEVTFPQDRINCTKCHQGGTESDHWNIRPTRAACGACHTDVDFAAGVGHIAQADDSGCAVAFCHGSATLQPSAVHLTEESTPNNPLLPTGLNDIQYFIDGATADNNVATVTFRITADNVALNIVPWPPANPIPGGGAFIADTSPSFLLAWALPQDGIDEPAEYNNLNSPQAPSGSNGNGAGQPPSIGLDDLITAGLVTTTDNVTFEAVISTDPFPAGAMMRAVALQGEMEQNTGTDNVTRTAPSKMFAIDTPGRRQVVDSDKCLACHERLELHGGNRVNNVQVCVFCHNPNLSSSGRTVQNPSQAVINAVGSDPLLYPEATNDIKELVHGIHAATDRPYEFVRNRVNGFYYNWSEVTFPGNLLDCEKCHIAGTYDLAPANSLWTTERITTGDPAETRDDIIAARGGMPNDTDLVNSPTASACFYCHDTGTPESHMVLQGGKLGITRGDAKQLP
jgi:OmcA/MtrC family decaheme c-type cytochrome